MPTKEILNSHSVTALKKEISKTNIKGYSKLKKAHVIDLMLQHKTRFHHMKMATKTIVASAPTVKVPVKIIIKKKKTTTPQKKLGSKWSYNDVVDDNDDIFLYHAERDFEDTGSYVDIGWITGITPKMASFWRDNVNYMDSLSKKKQDRIETIQEKINENRSKSLVKDLKIEFKMWKESNKDKKMTLKEAIESFEKYYF